MGDLSKYTFREFQEDFDEIVRITKGPPRFYCPQCGSTRVWLEGVIMVCGRGHRSSPPGPPLSEGTPLLDAITRELGAQ